jgi:tetratricopeptide repeat protein
MRPGPGEGGRGRPPGMVSFLDALVMPRDARGIVLACGFVGTAALGANALLLGDPIGFGYCLVAGVGYLFLQTRLVPGVLWLAIGLGGVAGATAGNSSDWLVTALAIAMGLVALLRPAQEPRWDTSGRLEPSPAPRRAITTLGGLKLAVGGRDLTARLTDRPRLHFLFACLLARAVGGRDSAIDRAALADEVAPGIASASQRDRLRKQLYKLQAALGRGFKGILRVNNVRVSLDLSGIEVDFVRLEDLSRLVRRRQGLIDQPTADTVRDVLETTAGGEFLAGFSELEQQVTAGRGTAAQAVDAARVAVAEWQSDLALALAEYQQAAGRPQASIAHLQSALAQSPMRQDLARRLVSAYLQTGQTARASETSLEYELNQEG